MATLATIFQERITLTDAQFKALPTTAINLVAAPGSGKIVLPHRHLIMFKSGATAYTNIDPNGWLGCRVGSAAANGFTSTYIANDNTSALATPLTDLTTMFNSTGDKFMVLVWPWMDDRGSGDDWGPMTEPDTLSSFANQPLQIYANNVAAGNFTGGNSGNSIVIHTTYEIVSTP